MNIEDQAAPIGAHATPVPLDTVIGFRVDGATHSNRKREGRQNYEPTTLAQYIGHLKAGTRSTIPPDAPKEQHSDAKGCQRALVPSAYRGYDARTKEVLDDKQTVCLLIDNDGGDADLAQAAKQVLGDVLMLVHNTYSDGHPAKGKRERLIIPLDPTDRGAQPIGMAYPSVLKAINNRLEALGCKPDRSMERTNQIAYYGLAGPWAEPRHQLHEGPILNLYNCQDILAEAKQIYTSVDRKVNGFKGKPYGSPFWNFNLHYPADALMPIYGWEQHASGHWKAPGQSTARGNTLIGADGGWYGMGSTLQALPVGHKDDGMTRGCSVDLFIYYELMQRRGMSLEAATTLATETAKAIKYGYLPDLQRDTIDPLGYMTEFTNHGQRLWEEFQAAKQTEREQYLADNPLPEPLDSAAVYSTLPEPTIDPIFEVASWVYAVSPVKSRDMAILVAWLLVAGFSGRKDSFLGNPATINVLLFAITGVGKDTLNKCFEAITQALREAQDETLPLPLGVGKLSGSFGVTEAVRQSQANLSGLRIISEAGLNKQSNAGDKESVRAAALQNQAKNAYSQHEYTSARGALPMPYGPQNSDVHETTPESYSKMGGQVSHGDTSRKLTVRIDQSAIPENGVDFFSVMHVPHNILVLFQSLLDEAQRGEDLLQTYAVSKTQHEPALCLNPVPKNLQRHIQPAGPEEVKFIEQLGRDNAAMRRANKDGKVDVGWAMGIRGPQMMFRIAAVACRVEHVCGPDRHRGDPKMQMRHLLAAKALMDESVRTELANSSDYADPLANVVKAVRQHLLRMFKKNPAPAQYTKDKKLSLLDFSNKVFRVQQFPVGTGKARILAAGLVEAGKYRDVAHVFQAVLAHGDLEGHWTKVDGSNDKYSMLG